MVQVLENLTDRTIDGNKQVRRRHGVGDRSWLLFYRRLLSRVKARKETSCGLFPEGSSLESVRSASAQPHHLSPSGKSSLRTTDSSF